MLCHRLYRHNCEVDSIDRAIIAKLMVDSSLTNTELADRVGLTPSPCMRRVRRLEEAGIILGYRAQVDPGAVGRAFEVHVDIELAVTSGSAIEQFETALVAFEEVVEAHRLFGQPDYLVRVAVADLPAYEQFLTGQLMNLPGLGRLQSRFAMKTVKAP